MCSVCCQQKGCALFMYWGLDKTFGNFETKTKSELLLVGEKKDDSRDWLLSSESFDRPSSSFSPKFSISVPFSLCHHDVSEVVFWEAKVTSQLHILGINVSFYFSGGVAKVWGMCVVRPYCYSKEFSLCLQGERLLDGQLQLWGDVGKPFEPGCCFHTSSPSSDLPLPSPVLGFA